MSVADGSPGATRRKGFTYWGLPRPKSTTLLQFVVEKLFNLKHTFDAAIFMLSLS